MLCEFVLLILTNVAAMDASELLFGDEEKRLYNFGLGKRAYSYVSEYKRLPVYNFGLGKRAEGKTMYSFGLGKRYENNRFKYDDDEDDSTNDSLYSALVEKRAKSYNFGLGKRLSSASASPSNYNFGLGKKAAIAPHYSFGLGKRLGQYNFGLGKRQGKYSFGLGKKDRVYSFGLGKRFAYLPAGQRDEIDYEDTTFQDEKRSPKSYSFGLGKRSSHSTFESQPDNIDGSQSDYNDDDNDTDTDDDNDGGDDSLQHSSRIHSERDARDTRYAMQLPLKSITQSTTDHKSPQGEEKKF